MQCGLTELTDGKLGPLRYEITARYEMEETYIKFRGMLKEFDVLSIRQNPEEEPFKYKYEARKLMVRCSSL